MRPILLYLLSFPKLEPILAAEPRIPMIPQPVCLFLLFVDRLFRGIFLLFIVVGALVFSFQLLLRGSLVACILLCYVEVS